MGFKVALSVDSLDAAFSNPGGQGVLILTSGNDMEWVFTGKIHRGITPGGSTKLFVPH